MPWIAEQNICTIQPYSISHFIKWTFSTNRHVGAVESRIYSEFEAETAWNRREFNCYALQEIRSRRTVIEIARNIFTEALAWVIVLPSFLLRAFTIDDPRKGKPIGLAYDHVVVIINFDSPFFFFYYFHADPNWIDTIVRLPTIPSRPDASISPPVSTLCLKWRQLDGPTQIEQCHIALRDVTSDEKDKGDWSDFYTAGRGLRYTGQIIYNELSQCQVMHPHPLVAWLLLPYVCDAFHWINKRKNKVEREVTQKDLSWWISIRVLFFFSQLFLEPIFLSITAFASSCQIHPSSFPRKCLPRRGCLLFHVLVIRL